MAMAEAIELERSAFLRDKERQQRLEDRKQKRMAATTSDQFLTREEREAKIWAFM